MTRFRRSAIILACGTVLAAAACVRVGEMKEKTESIPLGDIKAADIRVKMGAGEIKVRAGADDLLASLFQTNIARWEPVVEHHPAGNGERVTIEQRRSAGLTLGHARNTWDLKLTEKIPLELDLSFGAGKADIDLRGVQVKRLTVHMGAGEVKLDLSGDRSVGLDGILNGGVGSGTITLPSQVGVRVRVDGGIGSVRAPGFAKNGHEYTNEVYDKTSAAIELSIHAGIGSIDLRLAGPKTAAF
jgi:hypothetical protein